MSSNGTSRTNRIVVVGSVALDDLETPFGKATGVLGGSASYFSVAASLFAPVGVVAVVGSDMPPEILTPLRARGVDLTGLQVAEGATFRWGGRYDYDLNATETLYTELGVFAQFHPQLPAAYLDSGFVFCANIQPQLQAEVLRQVRAPRLTMLDSMNLWINTERPALVETIGMVDMVSLNEAEVRLLAGHSSVIVGAQRILALGPKAVLVKKGEYGAVMFTEDETFFVPAYPLEEVRDPTGAGDSFAGGFLGYLAQFDGDITPALLRRAVVYGSAVASFTVEDFGLERLRTLTRAEIEARYRAFRRMTHFEDGPLE